MTLDEENFYIHLCLGFERNSKSCGRSNRLQAVRLEAAMR